MSSLISDNPIRNITVSAGEDIFIEWLNTDPIHITWTKDGQNIARTTADSEGRVFTMPNQGLLILNSEWEDRGFYRGLVVTNQHTVNEQVFWVDVAPSQVDEDMNTGGCKCKIM